MNLRSMTIEDADRMLEWKNYPETRMFSIVSHDVIKISDHINWLKDNLQFFQVVELNGEACGAVRVQDNEISIWVDRRFRGRGVATEIVKSVSKSGFVAKIVEGNIPSMRCFIRAGYLPVSYQDGYYIFKLS